MWKILLIFQFGANMVGVGPIKIGTYYRWKVTHSESESLTSLSLSFKRVLNANVCNCWVFPALLNGLELVTIQRKHEKKLFCELFFLKKLFQWFSCTSFSRRWMNRFCKFQKKMRVNGLIPCMTLFDFWTGCQYSGNYRLNLRLSVSRPLLVIGDWFFYLSSSNFLNFFFRGQIL